MSAGWFAARETGAPYFCVVGSPIGHSLSPRIHRAFAAQTGRELVYERIEVASGHLAAAMTEFRRIGGCGMNVTVPLKREAWELADTLTSRARRAGAANTLSVSAHEGVSADNTDGVGIVRDLEHNLGIILADRDVLVLGAGGAVSGVLPALLDAGAHVRLSNRTRERAEELRDALAPGVAVEPWGGVGGQVPDVLINGTSLSLHGATPPLDGSAVGPHTVCYDMVYAATATPFVSWASAAGAAQAVDGLGMLVEQAAEAFRVWHGVLPDTAPVLAALRDAAA